MARFRQRLAHCGPCTPLKLEAIRIMHELKEKHPEMFQGQILGDSAEELTNTDTAAFLDVVSKMNVPEVVPEDVDELVGKLAHICLTLQDIDQKLLSGEFEVVEPQHREEMGQQ